jgi:hypothetical protein
VQCGDHISAFPSCTNSITQGTTQGPMEQQPDIISLFMLLSKFWNDMALEILQHSLLSSVSSQLSRVSNMRQYRRYWECEPHREESADDLRYNIRSDVDPQHIASRGCDEGNDWVQVPSRYVPRQRCCDEQSSGDDGHLAMRVEDD